MTDEEGDGGFLVSASLRPGLGLGPKRSSVSDSGSSGGGGGDLGRALRLREVGRRPRRVGHFPPGENPSGGDRQRPTSASPTSPSPSGTQTQEIHLYLCICYSLFLFYILRSLSFVFKMNCIKLSMPSKCPFQLLQLLFYHDTETKTTLDFTLGFAYF
jgi:hypothetical protein